MGDLVLALLDIVLLNGVHDWEYAIIAGVPAVGFLIGLGIFVSGIFMRRKGIAGRWIVAVGAILMLAVFIPAVVWAVLVWPARY